MKSHEHDSNFKPVEAEISGELRFAAFETYRSFCGQEDNSRRVGILDEVAYGEALLDNRTLFTEIDGKLIPALVAIEHEDGYDARRCAGLTRHNHVMLASLPFSRMVDGALSGSKLVGDEGLHPDFSIVIEQPADVAADADARKKVVDFFSKLGPLTGREFIDERVKDVEGHESAWLALYSFSLKPSEYALEQPAALDFADAWSAYREENGVETLPGEGATGTFLLTADQLREHPEIVDSLWEISEYGFGKILGMYHPVSMEETKDVFKRHIFSQETYTAVHFEDGEPVCFGNVSFDLKNCEWLNLASSSLGRELESAEQQSELPVWFSEVISKGIHHSHNIFQLFLDLAGRTQKNYRILYESTNFSSTYIPPYAARQVDRCDRVTLTRKSEQLDRLDYWFLEPANSGD